MKGGFLMKKVGIILLILLAFFTIKGVKAEEVMIPEEAIRFRVVPNSNYPQDQWIKSKVRDNVQVKIYELMKNVKSIGEARTIMKENLPEFEMIVDDTLKENKMEETFQIKFGQNYFPKKVFKGVTYEEGYYESIVITLGKGEGDNWWCVLFPPLCLLEAEETQEQDEVQYKSFVKELIDQFFKN